VFSDSAPLIGGSWGSAAPRRSAPGMVSQRPSVELQVEVALVPSSHRVCSRPMVFSSYVVQRAVPAITGMPQALSTG
jgi:hypothetical protein